MAKSECEFDLGTLDIVVSLDRFGGLPYLEVSEDINSGEYRTTLAVIGPDLVEGGWWNKPALFTWDTDGYNEFKHWAGALCLVGNATIDQTIGFFKRLDLLLKVDMGFPGVKL